MYEFVDTNAAGSETVLPAEAISINGEYLDNVINGYRTLYATGRELMPADVELAETATGETYRKKKYGARTITVGYQIKADTAADFRAAYNLLQQKLDVEQAQIIFADEDDKFFVGTPEDVDNVDSGELSVTGEFAILCADPQKYSVEEYEVSAADDLVSIDYAGTRPASPIITTYFHAPTEFVNFVTSKNASLSFGSTSGSESLVEGKTLICTADDLEDVQESNPEDARGTYDYLSGGMEYTTQEGGKKFMRPYYSGYDGSTRKVWGPTVRFPLAESYENLRLETNLRVIKSSTTDTSLGLEIYLGDAASITIYNNFGGGNYGMVKFWVGETTKVAELTELDFSETSTYWQDGVKCVIQKYGGNFKFSFGDYSAEYYDSSYIGVGVSDIEFSSRKVGAWGYLNAFVYGFSLYKPTFTYDEIDPSFYVNQTLTVNTSEASVKLKDSSGVTSSNPEFGSIYNAWDDFKLIPGTNNISVGYVSNSAPTVKFKYREVFL